MSDDIFLSSYESLEEFASNDLCDDISDLLYNDSEEESTGLGHASAQGRAGAIIFVFAAILQPIKNLQVDGSQMGQVDYPAEFWTKVQLFEPEL